MDVSDLLIDLFSRVDEHVDAVLDGLSTAELLEAPEPGSNPAGWLLWHLTRVEDSHVSEITGEDQVWVQPGWSDRFGVAPDPSDVGYGHSPEQVRAVRPADADAVRDYHAAVSARTRTLLAALTPDALDRIVDRRWDPPVTMGVRLVSIADDAIQHAGQAAYVKGLLRRR